MLRESDMHIQGPQIQQFNNIQDQKLPRSAFKRDFTRRGTFNSDLLIPCYVDEILPGDEINVQMTAQVRMTTPVKPLMDNLYLDTHWFFVPNRIVWEHWENLQGQQTTTAPVGLTDYTVPRLDGSLAPMSTTGFENQSLYDYLGLPTLVTGLSNGTQPPINALFMRAYYMIFNEWYRDEDLDTPLTWSNGDGPDDPSGYVLQYARKRKDYLTSCRPWAQKATTPVSIGLAGLAPVKGIGVVAGGTWASQANIRETDGTGSVTYAGAQSFEIGASPSGNVFSIEEDPNNTGFPGVFVDGSSFSAITINALRQAALYQQVLELDARSGTRYVEGLFARWGVISPDFRLQRPELIGQGSTRINVYSVPQTAPTASGSTPQGNLAAFSATGITAGHGCKYSATEHGMLLGIMRVRADITYQQNLPKMFTRSTRLDYYEPLLNGLGEQAVLNQEIMAQGTSSDSDVFGYQERFSEYRYKDSQIVGVFRSNDPQTLDVWHLSQEFGSLPALNSTFVQSTTPMDRVLAVDTALSPNFWFDANYSVNHVRVMPMRSNPGIDKL